MGKGAEPFWTRFQLFDFCHDFSSAIASLIKDLPWWWVTSITNLNALTHPLSQYLLRPCYLWRYTMNKPKGKSSLPQFWCSPKIIFPAAPFERSLWGSPHMQEPPRCPQVSHTRLCLLPLPRIASFFPSNQPPAFPLEFLLEGTNPDQLNNYLFSIFILQSYWLVHACFSFNTYLLMTLANIIFRNLLSICWGEICVFLCVCEAKPVAFLQQRLLLFLKPSPYNIWNPSDLLGYVVALLQNVFCRILWS